MTTDQWRRPGGQSSLINFILILDNDNTLPTGRAGPAMGQASPGIGQALISSQGATDDDLSLHNSERIKKGPQPKIDQGKDFH